jgi:DNA-binding GntR family transcriptional regulator
VSEAAGEDRGERTLLSEQIRKALTDEITSGALPAGSALDEQQLAERFGASRTPVREALRQLSTSGLVEMRPRRGVVVTQLSPERVMDMFEATAEIEALCVRLATHRASPLELSGLLEIHDASKAAVAAEDVDAYDELNRQFHERLYAATHNSFLAELALSLRSRLEAYRRSQLRQAGRVGDSLGEHAEILTAMAEGDGEMAGRRMRAHLLNAASAFARYAAAHTGEPSKA